MQKAKLLIAQEALEKEVEEFLERKYYERNKTKSQVKGYRNGYEPKKIRTAEGNFTLQIPQVRNTQEPFHSKLKQFFKDNPEVLERLAVEMYVRGLSLKDIEEAFYQATGENILSKSSILKLTEILWEDYEKFISRDLSNYEIVYLQLDAVQESIRRYYQGKEAILVAWGITIEGRKVLLHMALGNRESYIFCKSFLEDMLNRGLNVPLAVTSDGSPGLIKAIDEVFPHSLRIRCWVHKMRNLSCKVPEYVWEKIKPQIIAIRDALNYEEGKKRLEEFVDKYQKLYPSLVRCLMEDKEALLNHLKLPYRHRKTVRSTNLVERSFEEQRRRTKIIPSFLTEQGCLKLVFAVLYRASLNWRKIPISEEEIRQINKLREELGIEIPSKVMEVNQEVFREV
jgi:transposase-like protein